MDSQDLIKIGNRAKDETEDFINRHLNDLAKGWPRSGLYGSDYADYSREGQAEKRKISGILLTQ
jgi:hypothetical protein